MSYMERHPMIMIVIGVLGISLSAIFVKYSAAPSAVTAAFRLSWTVILMSPVVWAKREIREELLHIEKKQLLIIRILIGVFIAISVVIAIIQYNSNVTFIAQLMGVSWGALAGAFLAPFLYGLYWKRATALSVWASFLFSSVVMIGNIFFDDYFPAIIRSPINAGAFCMFAGLVIVPVVSLVSKPPKAEHVKFVFSCYDKKVVVSASEAIGDPIQED